MSELEDWRKTSVLKEYYVEKGWSTEKIARVADTSPALVTDYLSNRDLLEPSETKNATEEKSHTCPECGQEFETINRWSDHHQTDHFDL